MNSGKGLLFVISGASGCGKTTLREELFKARADLKPSISTTTRKMRSGEAHGMDYFFVDDAEYDRTLAAGGFLEWAQVHGNRYGTSRAYVEQCLERGQSLVLVLDVQGGENIKRLFDSKAILIFVKTPDADTLKKRLCGRASDSEDTIALRLINAEEELRHESNYDYSVVNGDLNEAVADTVAIVRAEFLRVNRQDSKKISPSASTVTPFQCPCKK